MLINNLKETSQAKLDTVHFDQEIKKEVDKMINEMRENAQKGAGQYVFCLGDVYHRVMAKSGDFDRTYDQISIHLANKVIEYLKQAGVDDDHLRIDGKNLIAIDAQFTIFWN